MQAALTAWGCEVAGLAASHKQPKAVSQAGLATATTAGWPLPLASWFIQGDVAQGRLELQHYCKGYVGEVQLPALQQLLRVGWLLLLPAKVAAGQCPMMTLPSIERT